MKKLLLSGFMAVTLMAAGTAQAGGLSLRGETGLAQTPIAASLAPMQFAVAADYVHSDDFQIQGRAEIGLPAGLEAGFNYVYADTEGNLDDYGVNVKYVLPNFVPDLGLAVGAHYDWFELGTMDVNEFDGYAVASYTVPMGEGMALVPSAGVMYVVVRDNSELSDLDADGAKFFGSIIFKGPNFAVGGEYLFANEDVDGKGADDSYWFGGRFFLNPMITLQAGYLNNSNIGGDLGDGVFHAGVQFAFGGAQ